MLANLCSLTLGLGCAILLFLFIDYHRNTDTFHPDAERIYRVVLTIKTEDGKIEYEEGTSLPLARALQVELSAVEKAGFLMKLYRTPTISIDTQQERKHFQEPDAAAYADQSLIELFKFDFINGNSEQALQAPNRVVLTEPYALKYFATTDVIGKTITLNHKVDLTISGVIRLPEGNSDITSNILISLPTLKAINPSYQDNNFTWIGHNNWTFVKLKNNELRQTVASALPKVVEKYLGEEFSHWKLLLQPLREMHYDVRYGGAINESTLWVLLLVIVFIVVIITVNYINLRMAHAYQRVKEIGVRKYLGATRTHLMIQMFVESLPVMLIALLLALLGSQLLLPLLNVWLNAKLSLNQLWSPHLIFLIIATCAGILFIAAYYPVSMLTRIHTVHAIQGKSNAMQNRAVLTQHLVAMQYTLSILFLIGTLTLLRQLNYMTNLDLGFVPNQIIIVQIPQEARQLAESFRTEALRLTGVKSVSFQNQPPLSASTDGGYIWYDNKISKEEFLVRDCWADDRFLETYSIKLVAGRNVNTNHPQTEVEVLVNETLLSRLSIINPEDILNKSITFENSGVQGAIVGVISDFHHRSLQNEIEPLAIYPFPRVYNQLGIKLNSDNNQEVLRQLGQTWKSLFPETPFNYTYLEQSIATYYTVESNIAKLMSLLSFASVLIFILGIISITLFSVRQRIKEIGIRKVLGARSSDIMIILASRYLLLILIATALAIPVSYFVLSSWLNTFAYRITLNWLVLLSPSIVLIILTIVLVLWQSIRALRVNPATSLRYE